MLRDDLDNLFKHFSRKQDKVRRKFYTKLIDDTSKHADIILKTIRDGELKKEYIKAYQHQETHDMHYILVTKKMILSYQQDYQQHK